MTRASTRYIQIMVLAALLFPLASTPGCLYLRLLQFKTQLGQFDTHFAVEDEKGLWLIAKEPVLLTSDVEQILKITPDRKTEHSDHIAWTYTFEKLYPKTRNEPGNYDIPFALIFRDNRLAEIRFSPRCLMLAPKSFYIAMFRAMGDSAVDPRGRKLSGQICRRTVPDPVDIPDRRRVLESLGRPYSIRDRGETVKLTYRYRIGRPTSDRSTRRRPDRIELTFRKGDGQLIRAEGWLAGLRVFTSFPTTRPASQPAPLRSTEKGDPEGSPE